MMLYKHLKLFFSIVLEPLVEFSSMEFKFEQHSSNVHLNIADGRVNSQVMTLSLLFCSIFDFMFVF